MFAALVSMNVVLVWLSPAATAIKSADGAVLAFAIWGMSHVEYLLVLAIVAIMRKTADINAETERMLRMMK